LTSVYQLIINNKLIYFGAKDCEILAISIS